MTTTPDITFSNSLADLAARVKIEHTAVSTALRDSVAHAVAAGVLLIEAKDQLKHGQWLPWLRDHCAMSERTAQLYMRCAKNREDIEKHMGGGDLTLNEAAAMLALSSDVRKLINFFQDPKAQNLDAEGLIKAAAEQGLALHMIEDKDYDPWFGISHEEKREWLAFALWLVSDGMHPQGAAEHMEWLLQRPFQNIAELMGEEGDRFRRNAGLVWSDNSKQSCRDFLANEKRSFKDLEKELGALINKAPPPRSARNRHRRQKRNALRISEAAE